MELSHASSIFGVGHGNAFRHQVDRFVMVGDGQAHAGLHDCRGLHLAGDAAVHGHDEFRIQRLHALERGLGQAVAFFEAQRDERACMGRPACAGPA